MRESEDRLMIAPFPTAVASDLAARGRANVLSQNLDKSTQRCAIFFLICALVLPGCGSDTSSASSDNGNGLGSSEQEREKDNVWQYNGRTADDVRNASSGNRQGNQDRNTVVAAPRSRDEIWAERMGLARLYMSHPGMRERVASRGPGPHVDQETREVFWPVRACNAPDCPARGASGEPHRFIVPNPGMFGASGASLGQKPKQASSRVSTTGGCPECEGMEGRSEEELRRRQAKWVRPYLLPESVERMKQLDAERRRLADAARAE